MGRSQTCPVIASSIQTRAKSLDWVSVEDFQGGCCHANSIIRACIRGYAHARARRSWHSPEQRSTASLGEPGASADPFVAIDRPGAVTLNQRPGVNYGTAAISQKVASGASRQDSSP